ncbi:hypothetical protein ABBQ38_004252 [Trebouxia sp. C0009 RCD-2024]
MALRRGLLRGLQSRDLAITSADGLTTSAVLASTSQQLRNFGSVPEFYGKPSPYSAGTGFLGTPSDHLERLEKRPISPHVFEIDGKSMHYKMPINAISSITNRATGVALTVGIGAAGAIALVGDLPAAVEAFTASYPSLVYPAKAVITWPLFYHYLGGVRHIIWEKHRMGKQAEKKSYLENEAVNKSSRFIFATSIVGTLGLTVLQF